MDNNYILQSKIQTQKAQEIIQKLNIIGIWEASGATINLIGSLKLGLLAKHRDIDFHIYTPSLNVMESFGIISKICNHPQIKKCEFTNLSHTDEHCFEWHLWYEDNEQNLWQIDMIQILQGTKYEGYFENIMQKILHEMTALQKQTILKLKYETPDDVKISGIEYYKAVIQDNIQTLDELLQWRKKQNFSGIIDW